jgi:hypothetical protein
VDVGMRGGKEGQKGSRTLEGRTGLTLQRPEMTVWPLAGYGLDPGLVRAHQKILRTRIDGRCGVWRMERRNF